MLHEREEKVSLHTPVSGEAPWGLASRSALDMGYARARGGRGRLWVGETPSAGCHLSVANKRCGCLDIAGDDAELSLVNMLKEKSPHFSTRESEQKPCLFASSCRSSCPLRFLVVASILQERVLALKDLFRFFPGDITGFCWPKGLRSSENKLFWSCSWVATFGQLDVFLLLNIWGCYWLDQLVWSLLAIQTGTAMQIWSLPSFVESWSLLALPRWKGFSRCSATGFCRQKTPGSTPAKRFASGKWCERSWPENIEGLPLGMFRSDLAGWTYGLTWQRVAAYVLRSVVGGGCLMMVLGSLLIVPS